MDGPTFCWHCGKKLQLPYFTEITDQVGYIHRVHKCCAADAKESVRKLTADCDTIQYAHDCVERKVSPNDQHEAGE